MVSQRGAKSRIRIRLVLRRVQDEAEIIPNEPGQVMLLRDRALKKMSLIFLARGHGALANGLVKARSSLNTK